MDDEAVLTAGLFEDFQEEVAAAGGMQSGEMRGQTEVSPDFCPQQLGSVPSVPAFPQDRDFAKGSSAINIVVGAANKKVYFFNGSGVIGSPMKLKDFTGGPQ